MTSPRQRAANIRNAKKARGPVTTKGKAVSSRNAIKHGLNQKIDPLTHPVVAAIEKLYIQEGVDPEAARRLALAHVERERVRSARIEVCRSEYHTKGVSNHGKFHNPNPYFLREMNKLLGGTDKLQKLYPHMFSAPDDSEVESDIEVTLRVLKCQSAFNRYEVRAVSQLSKAARAAFLPLPKSVNTLKRKAGIQSEDVLKQK